MLGVGRLMRKHDGRVSDTKVQFTLSRLLPENSHSAIVQISRPVLFGVQALNKESIQYSVFEVSSQGCQSSPCVRGDCEVEGLSPTPNMGINSAPSRGAPFCLQFGASKGARVPGCSIDAIRLARSGHVWTTPCMRGSGILPEALRAGGKGRVCDGRTTNSSFLDRPSTPTRHRLLARIYPSKAQIPIDPTGVHEIDVLIRFEKRDACAS